MCILGWRTMLHEEVFLYVAPKSHFPFFEWLKRGVCEATTKQKFQNGITLFFKNNRPPYIDNFPTRNFVKQPPNKSFTMVPPHFSKIPDHLTWTVFQLGYLKPFRPLFMKKTNSCRISWKSVRFELQVYDLMLIIFWKNYF